MDSRPSLAKPSRAGPEPVERTIGSEARAQIDLKSYDWTKMPLGFSWYIFGGSGKGKTILLDNIMYHNARRFHSGFLQTPTQDVIEKFSEHMPIAYINPKHSVEQIDTVDELKKEIISKYPRGEKDDMRPMFMILDDVAYNRDFCQDQIFNKITFNGRHQNFTMFLASQKYKALENNARFNAHFFVCYWDSSISVRKTIWAEQFSSCFESYDDFEFAYKTVCCPPLQPGQQFARPRCLIVDKRYSQSNPNDCCFFYEPQFNLPPYSIGSRDYLLIGWWASKLMNKKAKDVEEKLQTKLQQIMQQYEEPTVQAPPGAQLVKTEVALQSKRQSTRKRNQPRRMQLFEQMNKH